KYKGGKWVDHMTISCSTTKVRTDDLKAMDNYTTKKSSYIYNIKNNDDNLCFIRYIIITRFLSKEEHTPYLLYEDENEKFKNHYVSRRVPLVNPDMIKIMDLFFPYIDYPHEEIWEKAINIRKKHFGD